MEDDHKSGRLTKSFMNSNADQPKVQETKLQESDEVLVLTHIKKIAELLERGLPNLAQEESMDLGLKKDK